MKELFLLTTVLNLLLVGTLITVRSGVVEGPFRHRMGVVAGNVGGLVFRLLGYLVALLAVHRIVGMPVPRHW